MARYIDADKFIEELKELQQIHSPSMSKIANEAIDLSLSLAMRTARKTPTADVEEVKHGHWIYHPDDLFPAESTQECSICHEEEDITLVNENYCPNCGAKMDERKETT